MEELTSIIELSTPGLERMECLLAEFRETGTLPKTVKSKCPGLEEYAKLVLPIGSAQLSAVGSSGDRVMRRVRDRIGSDTPASIESDFEKLDLYRLFF